MTRLRNALATRPRRLRLALVSMATMATSVLAACASGGKECEGMLAEAKRIAERNVRSERVGLWERLRAVREVCSGPEVPATVRARAAVVYRILPEYSEARPRVAMLESLEEELERLPAPTPELIEIVELKAGAFEIAGKTEEAVEGIEKSVRLRAALYGEESKEFAAGLLGSARFHASIAAQSPTERELALTLADRAIGIALNSPKATEKDRSDLLAEAAELLSGLGLSPAEITGRISQLRK